MKRLLKNTCFMLIVSWTAWLIPGCTSNPAGDLMPQSDCRIQTYTAIAKGGLTEENSQTVYSYDATGNLTRTAYTYARQTQPDKTPSQTGTKTTTYTYNPDGFLTASRTDQLYVTISGGKTFREPMTTTVSYAYTAGRLMTFITKSMGAYGLATTTTSVLTYDATGDRLTRTDTDTTEVYDPTIAKELPTGRGSVSRISTYQKNVLVDYTEKSGTTETHPLTIQNGLITRITGVNFEVRYTYDSNGRMTKMEGIANGEPLDYMEQRWTDAKSHLATLPVPKGIPTVLSVFGTAQSGVLASHTTYYRNTVNNTWVPIQSTTSVVQTNAQGFVSAATITDVLSQNYSTTETYTYTGCP